MDGQRSSGRPAAGFLTRLARDARGNTLAMMAAILIPLIGLAGSAVDMSRLYVVKARLQQACDAGALAGRKAMTDTSPSTPLDATAASTAQTFFANNFRSGWFQNSNVSFTPTKVTQGASTAANAVNGTATVQVPMTLMQFFGQPTVTESVSCQALYDLADADIMFVLDNTGSMSCAPSDSPSCLGATATYTRDDGTTGAYNVEKTSGGTNVSKMEALRQAVLLFDSTMRSNADPSTHFRYGFVPYTSATNVGAAIPSQYLQAGPTYYQTRTNFWNGTGVSTTNWDYNYTGNWKTTSGATVSGVQQGSMTGVPQAYCVAQRVPASGYTTTGASWGNAGFVMAVRITNVTWTSANGGTCTGTQQPLRPQWHYNKLQTDTTSYLNSIGSGTAVTNPSRVDGSTMKWRGCIEELDTTATGTFNVNSLPDDLNPDVAPSSSTDKWRPMMQEAEWLRSGTAAQDLKDEQISEDNYNNYYNLSYGDGHFLANYEMMSCPMKASRLAVMTAQQVHDYVYDNDFRAWGSTYHDIGMIWGTRMLSPNGIFGADTAPWPGRNAPQRSIVFMTDGTMETFPTPLTIAYQSYGAEYYDGRIDAGNTNNDSANHIARFRVECDAAKARGITIYAVSVGLAVSSDMTYCASPGQTFQASNTAALSAAFKTIAQRVAELRISQ